MAPQLKDANGNVVANDTNHKMIDEDDEFFLPLGGDGENRRNRHRNHNDRRRSSSASNERHHPGYDDTDDEASRESYDDPTDSGYTTDGNDTNELFSIESGYNKRQRGGEVVDDDTYDDDTSGKVGGDNDSTSTPGSGGYSSSSKGGASGSKKTGSSTGSPDIPAEIFAKEETLAVMYTRTAMFCILLLFAAAAGISTFVMSKRAEFADFEIQVRSSYKCVSLCANRCHGRPSACLVRS